MVARLVLVFTLMFCVSVFAGERGGDPEGRQESLSWEFTFEHGTEGWTGDFTDLPVDYEQDMYQLEFAHADTPEDLGVPGKALMLSSINRSDDVFMYVNRHLGPGDGILPNARYEARFMVEFATNAPPGAFGVGGPPGEAVWVKVGAAPEEPVPVVIDLAGTPFYTLSVDKGWQNDDGEHAIRIGDVAKEQGPDDDFSYALKTLDNLDRPLEVDSDEDGNLWIFVGTDSGFEGKTTLYYTNIAVTLEPIEAPTGPPTESPTAVQTDSWGAIKSTIR